MSKYLILSNMFSRDLKTAYFDLAKLNESVGSPFAIISPVSIVSQEKDAYIQLIAAAVNIDKIVNEIEDKPVIYLGPSTKNISFDKIFTLQRGIVSTQEKTILSLVEGLPIEEVFLNFYFAEDSEMNFNSMEEAFNYIKELHINV